MPSLLGQRCSGPGSPVTNKARAQAPCEAFALHRALRPRLSPSPRLKLLSPQPPSARRPADALAVSGRAAPRQRACPFHRPHRTPHTRGQSPSRTPPREEVTPDPRNTTGWFRPRVPLAHASQPRPLIGRAARPSSRGRLPADRVQPREPFRGPYLCELGSNRRRDELAAGRCVSLAGRRGARRP